MPLDIYKLLSVCIGEIATIAGYETKVTGGEPCASTIFSNLVRYKTGHFYFTTRLSYSTVIVLLTFSLDNTNRLFPLPFVAVTL